MITFAWSARFRSLWFHCFRSKKTRFGLGQTLRLGVEPLERREVLDTGIGQLSGLSGSPSQIFVTSLYYDLLQRTPGASEVAFWTQQVNYGVTHGTVAAFFDHSTEYLGDIVQHDYQQFLSRN